MTRPKSARTAFYRGNFVDLIGPGLHSRGITA